MLTWKIKQFTLSIFSMITQIDLSKRGKEKFKKKNEC